MVQLLLPVIAKTDKLRKLEVTISSIYWPMITLFPHLMMMDGPPTSEPSAAAAFMIPLSVDLALHAAPGMALLLDFYFIERRYTGHQVARVAPLTAVLFGLWYVSWVEYCATHNGRCELSIPVSGSLLLIADAVPYPFLEAPYHIRALVYIGAVFLAIFSFRVLNSLHS